MGLLSYSVSLREVSERGPPFPCPTILPRAPEPSGHGDEISATNESQWLSGPAEVEPSQNLGQGKKLVHMHLHICEHAWTLV
ncbi:hypothetical protein AC578_4965 [Pseudocercospora eumusae]|uniref:Uncharacterized protein n=1 Tax=Pseudocercospora eumusae TaxID=321146 RepID=A0A139HNL7_9PEZI|nr:hypothetical protein AC578_4965 [Pseudocercospora eumusae]